MILLAPAWSAAKSMFNLVIRVDFALAALHPTIAQTRDMPPPE